MYCEAVQVCSVNTPIGLALLFAFAIDGVAAQNGSPDWAAVGISWVISAVTTVILIAIAFGIQKCLRSKDEDSGENYRTIRTDDIQGASPQATAAVPTNGARTKASTTTTTTTTPAAEVRTRSTTQQRQELQQQPPRRQAEGSNERPIDVEASRGSTSTTRHSRPEVVADGSGAVHYHQQPQQQQQQPVSVNTQHQRSGQAAASAAPARLVVESEERRPPVAVSQRRRDEQDQEGRSKVGLSGGDVIVPAKRADVVSSVPVIRDESAQQLQQQTQQHLQRGQRLSTETPEARISTITTTASGLSHVTPISSRQGQQAPLSSSITKAAASQPEPAPRISSLVVKGQGHALPPSRDSGQGGRQTADESDEEPAEPLRLAPRSERSRQQRQMSTSQDKPNAARKLYLAEEENTDVSDSSNSATSSSEEEGNGDGEETSTGSDESESDNHSASPYHRRRIQPATTTKTVTPSASANPREITLIPAQSSTRQAQPISGLQQTFPPLPASFTAKPVVPSADLLRPLARRRQQQQTATVRHRPKSYDGSSIAFRKAEMLPRLTNASSSTGLQLLADHDPRLSAWQRVQATMRPSHSEPVFAGSMTPPLFCSSPDPQLPSAAAEKPPISHAAATTAQPQVLPSSTSGAAAAAAAAAAVAAIAANQRLRHVTRDPTANPSPPVAVVQPSTSVASSASEIERRRRQQQQQQQQASDARRSLPPYVDTRVQSAEPRRPTQNRRSAEIRTKPVSSSRRHATADPRKRQSMHSGDVFAAFGPVQTSTPAQSGPPTPVERSHHRRPRSAENKPRFDGVEPPFRIYQGLMSDDGLRQIASSLTSGHGWRRLAVALRLPTSSHSHSRTTAIYETLKDWRDRYPGDVDRVRARLCDALVTAKRADLAQKLVDEKDQLMPAPPVQVPAPTRRSRGTTDETKRISGAETIHTIV